MEHWRSRRCTLHLVVPSYFPGPCVMKFGKLDPTSVHCCLLVPAQRPDTTLNCQSRVTEQQTQNPARTCPHAPPLLSPKLSADGNLQCNILATSDMLANLNQDLVLLSSCLYHDPQGKEMPKNDTFWLHCSRPKIKSLVNLWLIDGTSEVRQKGTKACTCHVLPVGVCTSLLPSLIP